MINDTTGLWICSVKDNALAHDIWGGAYFVSLARTPCSPSGIETGSGWTAVAAAAEASAAIEPIVCGDVVLDRHNWPVIAEFFYTKDLDLGGRRGDDLGYAIQIHFALHLLLQRLYSACHDCPLFA